MSEVIRWFLAVQVMAGAGWFATLLVRRVGLSATGQLRISRALMVAALTLPILVAWLAVRTPWSPETQVWTVVEQLGVAPSVRSLSPGARPTLLGSLPSLPSQPWPVLLYGSIALAVVWSARSWTSLRGLVARASSHEVMDDMEVLVSDEISVPFAVWLPGRRLVVVDQATRDHASDYAVALWHEQQHHEERDPLFAYLTIMFQSLCVVNPLAHFWAEELRDLAEFACDERVLETHDLSPKRYGQALVRAAQRATGAEVAPYAVGLTRMAKESLLHRRLQRLGQPRRSGVAGWPLLLVSVGFMAVAAWFADAFIVGPGLTRGDVRQLVARSGDMEIVYPDAEILEPAVFELVGQPEEHRFVRRAVFRGQRELGIVRRAVRARSMPMELTAIPVVESGLSLLYPRDADDGAGIWRLAPPTARAHGLTVRGLVDERLDAEADTRAALGLLQDLHGEFGDWILVLAAYNQGARHVREAIEREGTRDPWELYRRGVINDYPLMVLAAALLLENPEFLRNR